MALRFGLSKKNITPVIPTCLACSQKKDTPYERIHDDIFLRCAVLESKGRKIIILSYDLLFPPRGIDATVREFAKSRHGVEPPDILISCTHNHNSPSTLGYNDFSSTPEYEDFLKDATAECIDEAFKNIIPGKMEYGAIQGNWNINRRRNTGKEIRLAPNPEGPVDNNIYILRLISGKGDTRGLLLSYACHPVHYPDPLAITSEYPGFLCKYLEEEFKGCIPLFVQGAGADSRPLSTVDGDRFTMRPYEFIEDMAMSMKNSISAAVLSGELIKAEPSFASVSFRLEIPTEDLGKEYFRYNINNPSLSEHLKRNAKFIFTNYASIKPSFSLECGIIRLAGDLVVAHMGGEPCCEIKFMVEKALSGLNVFFAGYTDSCAYIVTDRMIDEGGYEVRCFIEYLHKGRIRKGIDEIIDTGFREAAARLT
ncbi:MAG: hypothetical protein JXB33_07685 [Clostridia bacterium]|nr:hypothetical protein [Clostridia bacterium]